MYAWQIHHNGIAYTAWQMADLLQYNEYKCICDTDSRLSILDLKKRKAVIYVSETAVEIQNCWELKTQLNTLE